MTPEEIKTLGHAFFDGKVLQYEEDNGDWCYWEDWINPCCPSFRDGFKWRIKPDESPKVKTLTAQVAALEAEVMRLRNALEAFIAEHEECEDSDGWMAQMCSMKALHVADEALSTLFTPCMAIDEESYSILKE